jgi:NADH dehydrogenase
MPPHHSIVIVGGGFAGTTLVRQLESKRPHGVQITLISEESYTTFNPMLPEAVGASVFPEQVVAPIREMLDRRQDTQFIMGRVTRVDRAARTLVCRTLAGERAIHYDELVLAFGNRARLDLIPGLADHALPLKTVGDALHIRNVVLRRVAAIELERDPLVRKALGHFVVIGGGFSGVEVAGEIADCLRGIRRFYPRVAIDDLRVTVLQDLDRLLPELPQRLGEAALRSLRLRGVHVRLGARAASLDGEGILLSDHSRIEARTAICTIGTQPNPLASSLGVPLERGRIAVNPDFSVAGITGLWAVGDCAIVRNGHDGRPAPPTAQFAVRAATQLAANLRASLQGRPTTPFHAAPRGMMAAIGHRKGVALVFGIGIAGLPAWLLWRAFYLSQMPTLRRKLRIWVEWTWGMFFAPDITHLRFTRSHEVAAEEATGD